MVRINSHEALLYQIWWLITRVLTVSSMVFHNAYNTFQAVLFFCLSLEVLERVIFIRQFLFPNKDSVDNPFLVSRFDLFFYFAAIQFHSHVYFHITQVLYSFLCL